MLHNLDLVLKILFTFLIWPYYTLVALVNLLIPYKYRSKSIKNEVILVTGAGSGLGKSLSKKLAKLGARLVLIDIAVAEVLESIKKSTLGNNQQKYKFNNGKLEI